MAVKTSASVVAFCCAMSLCATHAVAQDGPRQKSSFFDRRSEGWFWYQDPPVEEDKEEVAPPPPPPVEMVQQPEEQPEQVPAPVEATPAPLPGSVAFLRAALPVALDVATDDPSPQNVERYLLLQKQAMDKAEMFSEMTKMVSTGHPDLDEGRRRPRQDTFAKQLEEQAEQRKREVLADFFKTNALVMFVDKTCSACTLMGENFYRMQQTHGLVWQVISLDGTLLPEEMAAQQSFDAGIAGKLGVNQGGAVFIASPPNSFIPVTWNPTGGSEIADRILLVAARGGLIPDSEFRTTQPVNPRINPIGSIDTGEVPDILKQADAYLRPSQFHINTPEAAQ